MAKLLENCLDIFCFVSPETFVAAGEGEEEEEANVTGPAVAKTFPLEGISGC